MLYCKRRRKDVLGLDTIPGKDALQNEGTPYMDVLQEYYTGALGKKVKGFDRKPKQLSPGSETEANGGPQQGLPLLRVAKHT